jgi:hypothetical protein
MSHYPKPTSFPVMGYRDLLFQLAWMRYMLGTVKLQA